FLGKRLPFRLDLQVVADLARVAQVLRKAVPGADFQRELALVTEVRGRASGRVTVGEWLDRLQVRVDARDAHLSCRYGRFPQPLDLDASAFAYGGSTVTVSGLRGRGGRSTFAGVSGTIDWAKAPSLRFSAGPGTVALGEVHAWLRTFGGYRQALKDFGPPSGSLALEGATVEGPLSDPQKWRFSAAAAVRDVAVDSVLLPGALRITGGRLAATDQSVSLSGASVALLDSRVSGSIDLPAYRERGAAFAAAFEGRVGRSTAAWIARSLGAPPELKVRRSLSVRRARFVRAAGGDFSYVGDHLLEAGPEVGIEARWKGGRLLLDRLSVRDAATSAVASVTGAGKSLHVGFKGVLRGETVDRLFEKNPLVHGFLEGDFTLDVDPDNPAASSLRGRLRVGDVEVPRRAGPPLLVRSATVRGEGRTFDLQEGSVSLAGQTAAVAGRVDLGAARPRVALTVTAPELDAERLASTLGQEEGRVGAKGGGKGGGKGVGWRDQLAELPAEGTVAFDVGRLRHKRFVVAPLKGEIRLGRGEVSVNATAARLCGIDLTGRFDLTPAGAALEVSPSARGADVADTLSCLGHPTDVMTGSFTLSGTLRSRAPEPTVAALLKGTDGTFVLKAEKGRFRRFNLLSKILGVLNVTELLRGRLPDLSKEGFGYRQIRSGGRVEGGKLVFDESNVDGESVNVFWDGSIDLVSEQLDLTVVVSPFKTADAIISRIPVVNYIMRKSFVSVPVYVGNELSDPAIIPLSPTAVGKGLVGLIQRTLLAPYRLIEPLLPDWEPSKPSQ
ncbi:MAG: AsmA-like C-terminal region-containing protein, partial [Deltaproteobacteria bacterium]|nr:AsmA-like C-terminal region-containing protein [Deltaproteobacteria bacterium]